MAAAGTAVDRSRVPAQVPLGSLISVISISEIRYEGFLIEMTSNPYTIGLRNVKIFGTEGRLKYGPQISASDKIYEYIYLRGSNIKDLQVISSPPPQSTPLVPHDPAIVRRSFAHPAHTAMASTSHGAAEVANVSTSAQPILPVTSFHFNQPRDPSASSSSFGGSLLPPPTNISRLAVPNYLPGLVGSSGEMSYFHQQLPPPPLSLMASQAPVQQQTQHQNANTSVVGGSSYFEHHHPLLPSRTTTSPNAVPLVLSTPSVQSNSEQSSPSQSLQTMNIDTETAIAPVTERLPSDSTEEAPETSLKSTTKTESTSSHHDKGQFSQGRDQVHGGPHEDISCSLGRANVNPPAIRRFKEDFDFEAMNKKFNKKEVWALFSKNNKSKAGGSDLKDDFFDFLSYGPPDPEPLYEQMERDDETFGVEIPTLQQDYHGKGAHNQASFGGRGYDKVRGSHRGAVKTVWRPRLK